jgi:hypothetical protein
LGGRPPPSVRPRGREWHLGRHSATTCCPGRRGRPVGVNAILLLLSSCEDGQADNRTGRARRMDYRSNRSPVFHQAPMCATTPPTRVQISPPELSRGGGAPKRGEENTSATELEKRCGHRRPPPVCRSIPSPLLPPIKRELGLGGAQVRVSRGRASCMSDSIGGIRLSVVAGS